MIGQRDYKRLFAYSSIENMGIIAVGVGLAGVATQGAMLHVVNHSVCKAALFLVAGNVLRSYGTSGEGSGRAPAHPANAALLGLAVSRSAALPSVPS
jgi:formate hydrogenlyase subunit 3/multisubunit Na+/H+ antiporter MnhD subunit